MAGTGLVIIIIIQYLKCVEFLTAYKINGNVNTEKMSTLYNLVYSDFFLLCVNAHQLIIIDRLGTQV